MKAFNLSSILACGFLFFTFTNSRAEVQEYIFTYDYQGASHDIFGVQRDVQLDAAMLLKDPSLIGSEVIGISVDIPTKEGCACDPIASAWLTRTLQVDGEFNSPDVMSATGKIKNIGSENEPQLRLEISFPEPYAIPEEGVYVGYSVNVLSCNVPGSGWTAKYPIVTVCDIEKPQSFMFHCTKGDSTLPQKYPEWTDLGESLHQALAMKVILKGQPMKYGAELEPLQPLYAEPNSVGNVYTHLNNLGTEPISSIEYSYTILNAESAITTQSEELFFDQPIAEPYTLLDLPFESPEKTGNYQVELKVDKINGEDNEYLGNSMFQMEVLPFLPVNRPLIEDYTGMWCGYCPEVYVTIHQMMQKYSDNLISISYHSDDSLQGVPTSNFPSSSYGLPKVYMGNRQEPLVIKNIEGNWLYMRRGLAPADINVKISWADESRKALRAESEVKFISDAENAEYMVTYALIEDNMSDSSWKQANYFSNDSFEGDFWNLFCGQPSRVTGIIYDDVIVNFPSPKGIPSSLPEEIKGEEIYKHSGILKLDEAICQNSNMVNYRKNIIKDSENLRIVALLIDGKTGDVKNAASSGYSKDAPVIIDDSGVMPTKITESPVLHIDYYSLDGSKHNTIPESGAFISVSTKEDGSVKTEKYIR